MALKIPRGGGLGLEIATGSSGSGAICLRHPEWQPRDVESAQGHRQGLRTPYESFTIPILGWGWNCRD